MNQDTDDFDVEAIRAAACAVLNTSAARDKARAARDLARAWRDGAFDDSCERPAGPASNAPAPPDRPARPQAPRLVAPGQVARRRLGTPAGRAALLHAIAHIELNAIDLAFDLVARFLNAPDMRAAAPNDRRRLVDDWFSVGDDEARHFGLLADRLIELGCDYGALDAHDGLWEAAVTTRHDFLARLAVAPMALEARGLDVTPAMRQRLDEAGDTRSADLLGVIYADEIEHVAAGARWFKFVCARRGLQEEPTFRELLRQHASGVVKPPFNDAARSQAGLHPGLYQDLQNRS